MAWGKRKEIEEMEKLIKHYTDVGKLQLAQELRVELAKAEKDIREGYLKTAAGAHLTQAQPKASGRPQFGPQNYPDFALTPFIAQNPMSLGGATLAPVGKSLFPWRDEEDPIEKRSPMWNLMGYA